MFFWFLVSTLLVFEKKGPVYRPRSFNVHKTFMRRHQNRIDDLLPLTRRGLSTGVWSGLLSEPATYRD